MLGWGGGDDHVPVLCTYGGCYATCSVLACAHMLGATLIKPWPKCYGKTKPNSRKKQLPKSPEMRDEFKIRSIEPVVNS